MKKSLVPLSQVQTLVSTDLKRAVQIKLVTTPGVSITSIVKEAFMRFLTEPEIKDLNQEPILADWCEPMDVELRISPSLETGTK